MIKRIIEKIKLLFNNDNIQELYCGHCDKDTKQKVSESGHERDSSHDKFECLECGYIKFGLTGEWMNVK
jgi:RNase P subunit RPR2